jgi:hypothetical protein
LGIDRSRISRRLLRLALGNKVRVRPRTPWRTGAYASDARPIVIGGCGRSGTTLLRVMLDSHPRICCGVESKLFLPRSIKPRVLERKFDLSAADIGRLLDESRSQAEFIDRFFAAYCRHAGKPRWAEKTPDNVRVIDYVLAHFPRARFVHVLRDGRDTVCSLRTHPSHLVVGGRRVPLRTRKPLDQCIDRWVTTVTMGLAHRGDPRYHEVRYEDLAASPDATLRTLLGRLDEPWDPAVLEFHARRDGSREELRNPLHPGIHRPVSPRSVGRWRSELTRGEADRFKSRAGDLLLRLGYAADDRWQPDG